MQCTKIENEVLLLFCTPWDYLFYCHCSEATISHVSDPFHQTAISQNC